MSAQRHLHVRTGGTLHGVIKAHVLQTFAEAKGNKSETARRVGVCRNTLIRWLQEWGVRGVPVPEAPQPGTDEFLNEEHA